MEECSKHFRSSSPEAQHAEEGVVPYPKLHRKAGTVSPRRDHTSECRAYDGRLWCSCGPQAYTECGIGL